MAKRVLDSLDGLSEDLKKEYRQTEDGKFVLQVDGSDAEDIGALKRAKDHEKNLRVAAEGERDTAKAQVTDLESKVTTVTAERDQARSEKGADVNALEKSWQDKLTAAEQKGEAAVSELTREVERLLVTNTAVSLAGEISTVPELFQDVISKRLKVEKGADGKYFTRVLDETGAPSAATVDELKQELLANKKYAAIIISGKGSGGGAGGSGSGGGADEKKWLDYSDTELVQLRKDDPEKYERLKTAHKQAA